MANQAIPRVPVTSSMAKSAGYDPETQTLHVEYHSGKVHVHPNVPPDTVEKLMAAESFGRFFNQFIRRDYPSRPFEADETAQVG